MSITNNNVERFDGRAARHKTRKTTAKAYFDYNYEYLKTQPNVSLTDLYWAIRLAAFHFPVSLRLSEKNIAGVVKTINAITALRNIFLEIFKIAENKYPNATIRFYKRTIVTGEVAPQVELDTDANDRLDSISEKDPSRVLAGIKNRSFYTSRIKNRHLNLDSKDDE